MRNPSHDDLPPGADAPLGMRSATALVIASMVGAGIFTTSGVLAADIESGGALLAVWLIGGALALTAALCFAELGAMMPLAGAEVAYLRRIFGSWIGYLAGLVTFTAGFAVPIAAVAFALGHHLTGLFPGLDPLLCAAAMVLAACAIHGYGVTLGSRFNDLTCLLKILAMIAFVIAGLWATPTAAGDTVPFRWGELTSPAVANGLVLVAFAYTGWNAAAYVGGELRDAPRTLPRALFLGTAAVTVLYVLVNVIFLRAATNAEMAGQEAIGHFTALRLFGSTGGRVFSAAIALLLVSTLSSFAMAGPRVAVALATHGEIPALFGRPNRRGAPTAAAILLAVVSLLFLVTASFQWLLEYVGFLLTLSTALTVVGLMVLRHRQPEAVRPFRVPFYPLLPVAFLALSAWMLVVAARQGREAAIGAATTLLIGALLRPLLRRRR